MGSYRSRNPNVLCPAVRIHPHPISEAPPVADFETHSRLRCRELGHLAGRRTIDNYDLIELDTSRVDPPKQLLDVVSPIRSPACNHVSHGGDPNDMPAIRCERGVRYGVLGVCVGSGQGVALVLENAQAG